MAENEGRKRSFWGWGWADRFPDDAARRQLASQLPALVGFEAPRFDSPPRIDEIDLPPSRLPAPGSLKSIIAADDEARIRHTYGRAYPDILRGFRRRFESPPDLVATPKDAAEVRQVLDWASHRNVAVIPFGGGTSVVGGVEPIVGDGFEAALSLDTRNMNRVLEVDEVSLSARIEAGALGPELEATLKKRGLTLRCFPQSFEFSTLGGWIATRAGGHFATLYTHIDDLVEATTVITPRGTMATRRLPASGAGPSPDRWVLGSEGILGVITEAWMRVRPAPTHRATASVRFERYETAVEAVRAIAQSGLYPSNCRLLDRREAALNMVAFGREHVLILGFESADHSQATKMKRALELCADHGGRCEDGAHIEDGGSERSEEESASTWKKAFIEAPYLMNVMASMGVIVDTFETACTWDRFESLHARVIAATRQAMQSECGGGFISCRFTHVYPDGPAPYFTFIAPGKSGQELEQWRAIKAAASEALMSEGGTITHHHAVGRTHLPWYRRQRPELFADALEGAKEQLDPGGVLNPGVLL